MIENEQAKAHFPKSATLPAPKPSTTVNVNVPPTTPRPPAASTIPSSSISMAKKKPPIPAAAVGIIKKINEKNNIKKNIRPPRGNNNQQISKRQKQQQKKEQQQVDEDNLQRKVNEALENCPEGEELKMLTRILQPQNEELGRAFEQIRMDLCRLLSSKCVHFQIHPFGSTISGLAFRGKFVLGGLK